jgi:hypothetical protein
MKFSKNINIFIFSFALWLPLFSIEAGAVEQSPVFGGSGGNKNYNLNCGNNAALIGVNVRKGSYLDQISIVCQRIKNDGELGDVFTKGPVGGNGGSGYSSRCKPKYVAGGVYIAWHIVGPITGPVTTLDLKCYRWSRSAKGRSQQGSYYAKFSGPRSAANSKAKGSFDCSGKQNVLRGLKGKYGLVIDSMQAYCEKYSR